MNKVLEVKDLVNDLLLEANDFSTKIIQENNWVEEIFGCYLKGSPNELEEKFISCKDTLEKQLETLNADQQETALKQLLRSIADIGSYERQKRFFDIFKYMVQKGVWSSRMICEAMINSDSLTYKNGQFWVLCFDFILSLLHEVDYKGVREIMKGCCEKAQSIPPLLQISMVAQLKGVEDVLTTIFDRDNCLLPGYFVINEIRKAHMDSTEWPHWKLNTLVSNFVESFRAVAQMVSIIGHTSMLPVVEHSGYGDHLVIPWKLDGSSLKFSIKGNIPYEEKLLEPQTHLLRYVLQQPYSRDMVCSMLGLQKTNKFHCQALEEELVELIVYAMESVENKTDIDKNDTGWLWLHLSSQLIYFVLFQFAVFPNIVHSLHGKLLSKKLKKGRDHLMWVLLQFISGSIQRKPVDNFVPVLKLYDLLYSDNELLPLPDITDPLCTHKMAVTCIWIHLIFKADADNVSLQRTLPPPLKTHYEFLQMQVSPNNPSLTFGSDYRVALLCNAYSTNSDLLSRPMSTLVEAVIGPQRNLQPPLSVSLSNNASTSSTGPTTPLSMSILDSLTIHAKMSLIHSIVGQVIKAAQSKSNMSLPPALVETYSRLLVYTEIESLGIKGFISQLLPTVFKSHAWGILYTLLEMFSYRMHHIQPHYRVQLLSHLHSLAAVPQTNQTQLHLCVESTALRLITGLGSNEVQPHLSRFLSEPKTLVSSESEELNRALVLTLARSMHITGTGSDAQSGGWCKELLNTVMQNTPHSWAGHTLQCFPPFLSEYFHQNTVQKENKQQLKKAVEEEYRNWMSMTNDNDIIAHFTVPGAPALFLCLLWKMILETERINAIAYKVLERIGARALSAHLRKFCDYLVFKFVISEEGQHVNDCVDAINIMIWKYNIVTIDRLVLCLALRTQEGNEAQVCFFIIQLLLFKSAEFRARVQEFVKENSSEHWKHSNWHEKHSAFHKKYPEKFVAEFPVTDQSSNPSSNIALPVYFGNVCLRFLPVFDIVIHRFLELPPVTKSLETLLDHLGCLYKFHDRPITYLYNTLHYYERSLRDRPALKRKLVSSILSTYCEARAPGWSLSEAYAKYMQMDNTNWSPELEYYIKLIQRVTDTISGRKQLHSIDWRFNEFPNAAVYALYMTCVELMALPLTHTKVANSILNVIYVGYPLIPEGQMYEWLNSVGLLMSALPDSYWNVLHEHIIEAVGAPEIQNWQYHRRPFDMFNFSLVYDALLDNKHTYTLALAHATWHHAGSGQISSLPAFMKDKLAPIIKSEEQLLYLCHLIGPFLPRFNVDRPAPSIMDLAIELFNILLNVDKGNEVLNYMDPICDLLYHIKYQYVGNLMKTEVEGIIRQFRPELQRRLRFIAHLNDVTKPTQ